MIRRSASAILSILSGMGAAIWSLMPSMMLAVHESSLDYEETIDALKTNIANIRYCCKLPPIRGKD